MLNSTEYCLSTSPEPYKTALTLEGLMSEEYKLLTNECAATEEKYVEAIRAHEAWKAAKAKEAWLAKLELDKKAQSDKLKALQKVEEEQKVAEAKKKEKKKQIALLKKKQEAEGKQKKLDELKAKKIVDAMKKKKQDDLKKKKKEKKLQKEQKKAEKAAKAMESEKGATEVAEVALVNEEKGMDVDTEREMSEAMAPIGPKRKQALKSASVVEESDGEGRSGLSKRVKMKVSGPMEGEEELIERCMCCHQDSAYCFACLASKKSIHRRTCSRCKTKKAACSFNKGTLSVLAISSEEVLELLQKLVQTVETLSHKVDILTGQVISLRGHMDDLVDDFQSEDINSPEELISDMEE
ncbi:hypothetical protein EV421DRAFT_1901466 [Armillaria borealis]|uniref:Uncharacterized protein n=1 Tax=Armillaria borealis TaxID=47425 RepID=A0AA39MUF1_9AGAR|nr:hypothetical protein EV421DRAFT_1901466 [Armillaria borealis]